LIYVFICLKSDRLEFISDQTNKFNSKDSILSSRTGAHFLAFLAPLVAFLAGFLAGAFLAAFLTAFFGACFLATFLAITFLAII
jgi:ABC-type phosphate transport system permease subunit|tara:strand:- start:183 stop:434 length:252 start_codon:yes stop_codon:yes gene_type:complete